MDELLWYTPDWDIWVKLAANGPVVYHDDITTAFRIHENSLTVTGSRDASDFLRQMQIVLHRHLGRISPARRRRVEPVALASIRVNSSLAAASSGNVTDLFRAAGAMLSLGPSGLGRYLRDSRLHERVGSRLRAKLAGAF